MRFAIAHKTATYLMVGFAYLAMVAGGGIGGLIPIGGILALIASWWWEPPLIRYEKWSWVWTVMSVIALVYSVLTAIITTDFLGVGAQFLAWLIVAKAFNRRAARDWQQMYLLAFLMLVAGSVLNAELSYGVCFLGFVVSTTWALTLFHLRREMEDNLLVKHAADRASERVEVRRILDSRRIVGPRFFAGTGAVSLGVFILAALVFLALPRVGIGMFWKARGGLTMSGFTDGVKLGGHGLLKKDPTVVMRVEIDPRYGARGRPDIHWRGVAFDRYSQGRWSRSKEAPPSQYRYRETATTDYRYLQWADRPADLMDARGRLARQEIWLDPLDSDALFGGGIPRIIETNRQLRRRGKPANERNDEVRLAHSTTIHYTAYSELTSPDAGLLRVAGTYVPPEFGVYTQLPREITPQTRALARQITAGATTNYDKVVAIQRWLTTKLTYSLQLVDPGAVEPVHFFLFDRKQGHCEYFASAFAVLARAADPPIPVRQVNGFLGGEWNEYQGYVAVRAGDAHSWAEVYFPTLGAVGGQWVTFDATPSGDPDDALGRGGDGWRARMGRFLDTLRFQWSKWVIDYDLASQLSLFKGVGRGIKAVAVGIVDHAIAAKDWLLARWWLLAIAGAGIAVFAWRRRPRGARAGEPGWSRRPRVRSTVGDVYDQVVRMLARAGYPAERAVTPRERAARMVARGEPGAAAVDELVELYYAAEWGGRRDPAAEARASELARAIRDALPR